MVGGCAGRAYLFERSPTDGLRDACVVARRAHLRWHHGYFYEFHLPTWCCLGLFAAAPANFTRPSSTPEAAVAAHFGEVVDLARDRVLVSAPADPLNLPWLPHGLGVVYIFSLTAGLCCPPR